MSWSSSAIKRGAAVMKQLIFPVFIVVAVAAVKPAYSEDEAIEASCYKQESEEGLYVGNVSITRPETAAVNCNSTYYDCKDSCIGCYYDQKLGKTVCYNAAGEIVAK